ncbi:hypothetical protein ACFY2W_23950 [Streptomyces sp. NPDC001262]
MKVIAVATGRSSANELAQAGAHTVHTDLTDTATVVVFFRCPTR